MAYSPHDKTVFEAAYSGILAGFAASGRWLQDETSGDYGNFAMISGAFTQEFDTRWAIDLTGSIPPNTLQVFLIEKCCKSVWENRFTQVTTETLTPGEYATVVESIIALIKAGDSYFTAQGITPDPWPTTGGGVVDSITAGPGISVGGTAPIPIVNNTGVLEILAGTGISVNVGTGDVTVSNTGVESVTAGTNVTVTGTATNPIINATGGGGETPTVVTIQTPGDSNPHTLTTRAITSGTELVVETVWLARDPTDGNDEGGRAGGTFRNTGGVAIQEGTTSKIWQQANAGGVTLVYGVTGGSYEIIGTGNGDGVTDWTLYIYEYVSQL